MPDAHVLGPIDRHTRQAPPNEQAPRRFDRTVELRMAGGEDDLAALGGVGGQVAHFGQRRRGGLFQQDVFAGVDRFARQAMADVGRRADRHRVEARRPREG